MLSILIPTYNFDVTLLIKEVNNQCIANNIEYEILVYDDASKPKFNKINQWINTLSNCCFKILKKNIGRSAIRNLLGNDAKYKNLLFIDAGTTIKNSNYIQNYLKHINEHVVNGGMIAKSKAVSKPYKLRWLYTKYREHNALCSSNFLIKKEVFVKFPFNESLKKYGFEDVLFFEQLTNNYLTIKRINNPVIHSADDDAETFIQKTEWAINNLNLLIEDDLLSPDAVKIYTAYLSVKKMRLTWLAAKAYKHLNKLFLLNFKSNTPFLFLFDIYRLTYLCYIKTKN